MVFETWIDIDYLSYSAHGCSHFEVLDKLAFPLLRIYM